MAQLIVRQIEEDVKQRLQRRALRHGVSMEEEVRTILRDAAMQEIAAPFGLGSQIAKLFSNIEGQDEPLADLPDEPVRPATFEE